MSSNYYWSDSLDWYDMFKDPYTLRHINQFMTSTHVLSELEFKVARIRIGFGFKRRKWLFDAIAKELNVRPMACRHAWSGFLRKYRYYTRTYKGINSDNTGDKHANT